MFLPYLMCGYAATLVLVLGSYRIVARSIPGLRGVGRLSLSLISALVGVLLLATRSFAPKWVTILCAHEAIIVARSHLDERSEELLRCCDEALYRSKQGGRNRVTLSRGIADQTGLAEQMV